MGRKRQRVRIGAPDRALTRVSGVAAVTELCDRLGVVQAVGPIKQREDVAGQVLASVAGLSSITAAGLARRITDAPWAQGETGLARVSERVLEGVSAARWARLGESVTIDLDASDVEVYGGKKRCGL
jgi:hypothetical protein